MLKSTYDKRHTYFWYAIILLDLTIILAALLDYGRPLVMILHIV
jgi:hypothetical protein